MNYRHPGHAFLARYGALQREEDVYLYVDFLRRSAGLSDEPAIDLSLIYNHFGIPNPIRAPLDEQQGILIDSNTGTILIKEDDPIARQRFTEGHELMELLFDAHLEIANSLPWSEQRKESLCDQGAADLLMPRSSFIPRLNDLGISFDTARSLSETYQTSLLATLVRMIQQGSDNAALIVWRYSLKPTEHKLDNPEKKLRIWWRTQTQSWSGGFIPKHKSVCDDSQICTVYETGYPYRGRETIDLGSVQINCQIEAIPMTIGDQFCVLSLLHCLH
ncbi:ImmA/IrrE family metallo-endopeptidase [Phormidesmis sp. 146-12]